MFMHRSLQLPLNWKATRLKSGCAWGRHFKTDENMKMTWNLGNEREKTGENINDELLLPALYWTEKVFLDLEKDLQNPSPDVLWRYTLPCITTLSLIILFL